MLSFQNLAWLAEGAAQTVQIISATFAETSRILLGRKKISDFMKRAYLAYFGMPLGDQDKSWAPHVVCSFCYSSLHAWQKKRPNRHLSFAVPMVWREPSNLATDCYFCLMETNGYTKKTRHSISYPNLPSAILPVPHSELYPVPVFEEQSPLQGVPLQVSEESPGNDTELSYSQIQVGNQIDVGTDSWCMSSESDSDYSKGLSSYVSQLVSQAMNQSEPNDLLRDLNLSKDQSKILASRLEERNMLTYGTSMSYYKSR